MSEECLIPVVCPKTRVQLLTVSQRNASTLIHHSDVMQACTLQTKVLSAQCSRAHRSSQLSFINVVLCSCRTHTNMQQDPIHAPLVLSQIPKSWEFVCGRPVLYVWFLNFSLYTILLQILYKELQGTSLVVLEHKNNDLKMIYCYKILV